MDFHGHSEVPVDRGESSLSVTRAPEARAGRRVVSCAARGPVPASECWPSHCWLAGRSRVHAECGRRRGAWFPWVRALPTAHRPAARPEAGSSPQHAVASPGSLYFQNLRGSAAGAVGNGPQRGQVTGAGLTAPGRCSQPRLPCGLGRPTCAGPPRRLCLGALGVAARVAPVDCSRLPSPAAPSGDSERRLGASVLEHSRESCGPHSVMSFPEAAPLPVRTSQ